VRSPVAIRELVTTPEAGHGGLDALHRLSRSWRPPLVRPTTKEDPSSFGQQGGIGPIPGLVVSATESGESRRVGISLTRWPHSLMRSNRRGGSGHAPAGSDHLQTGMFWHGLQHGAPVSALGPWSRLERAAQVVSFRACDAPGLA